MKLTKLLAISAVLTMTCGTFVSCGDDEPEVPEKNETGGDEPGGGNEPGGEQPGGGLYSPTASKQYLENVATDFLHMFNPDDQKHVIDLANYFTDVYGDLEVPDNWDIGDDIGFEYFNANSTMKHIRQALTDNNYPALSRAFAEVYDFKRFSGIYAPGAYSWNKVGESNDIVFQFNNANGMQCVLTATGTGAEWSTNAEGDVIRVPENVTVTLKEGSNTLASATVRSNVSERNHTATVNITAKVANIDVTADMNGTDSQITLQSSVKVSGTTAVTATATINGYNLCNRDRIESIIDNDDADELLSLVSNASAKIDILSRLQVTAETSEIEELIDFNDYYDSYDYPNKRAAQAACEATCNNLNSYATTGVYYSSSTKQAQLRFQPEFQDESWSSYTYWWWSVTPVLYFASDGTTYNFEDYFGNSRFLSVENLWDTLYSSYERLWR